MTHLESRGHEATDLVEGLKIELLPFQKQAVQWAAERELCPGGIQSFLWTKLPSVEEYPGQAVYYNPLLPTVSKTKPKLVRGGILAQNMGMGKTVICLALILKNPAPESPASGSPPSEIPEEPDFTAAFWDPDPNSEDDADADEEPVAEVDVKPAPKTAPVDPPVNPKRGSILSRGTLVVVSDEIPLGIQFVLSMILYIFSAKCLWWASGSKKPNRNLRIPGWCILTTGKIESVILMFWRRIQLL